jgi:hypothetical protein
MWSATKMETSFTSPQNELDAYRNWYALNVKMLCLPVSIQFPICLLILCSRQEVSISWRTYIRKIASSRQPFANFCTAADNLLDCQHS